MLIETHKLNVDLEQYMQNVCLIAYPKTHQRLQKGQRQKQGERKRERLVVSKQGEMEGRFLVLQPCQTETSHKCKLQRANLMDFR